MPFATNVIDGARAYYEDDGGAGRPVVVLGGFLDPIELVRRAPLPTALSESPEQLRLIFIDHRGHGRSDAPHDPDSYAMPRRVADVTAVLDDLRIVRAHIVGLSWGGRLALGIAEHAPARVHSIVIVGQQPYAIDPDGPLARIVRGALDTAVEPTIAPLVEAFESISGRYADDVRSLYLKADAAAMRAAWRAAISEGAVASRLAEWHLPVLFCMAAGDADFLEQARRAADEIPGAELIVVRETDHLGMDTAEAHLLVPGVLRTFARADADQAN
jgi:pimeloyl-ACP methyl ester carboxylesterase